VAFHSRPVPDRGGPAESSRWVYAPAEPSNRISTRPMPVHINLWLFRGRPPKDGREVEVVVRNFAFTPE
jgi:hypothetical protein